MKPEKNISKKTIYVDVDEEITGLIDKILSAKESVIALVVPRRSGMFTSLVNMKLLKRSADQNGKQVVLVTSSQSVVPLAGVAGLYVASNLSSKPYVPSAQKYSEKTQNISESSVEINNQPKVEDLPETSEPEKVESLEVDNLPKTNEETPAKKPKKIKKDKHLAKLKVPNFNKFRLGLVLTTLAVAGVLVFSYWALAVAPKATVTVKGDNQTKNIAFSFVANTESQKSDLEAKDLPSIKKESKKTETQSVPATGQKDKGNKASGNVTLQNCSDNDVNVPAGTGISSGGLTFIIQSDVALGAGNFTSSGVCKSSSPSKKVSVIAQNAGDNYNLSSRSYTVSNFSGVKATGDNMTGGTTQIVKVVSATDIETAKSKIVDSKSVVIEELKIALRADGYSAIADTIVVNDGEFIPAPAVGTESDQVSVTVNRSYSLIGVKTNELIKLIEKLTYDAGVDKAKQAILDNGLSTAVIQTTKLNNATATVSVTTKVVAGPQINQDELKKEIAGKKRGEAEKLISARPGISEVRIDTSPAWNSKVPTKLEKINLVIEGAGQNNGSDQKP